MLDAYASAVGVRRLLIDRGGLAGALGVLLYSPALNGVSMSVSAAPPGARIQIDRALDPHLAAIEGPPARQFSPTLESELPAGSTLALDVPDLLAVAPRVLSAGSIGGVGGAIGPLLSRLGAALRAQGVDVAGLESLFSGESAIAISPAPGHPSALVIVSRVRDMAAARTDLAAVEVPLSQLLASDSSSSGVVPAFTARSVDGVTAHQLPLASGLELDYAVFRGLVVISTSLSGIAAVASRTHTLSRDPAYVATLAGRPSEVTSLLFLDLSQLLSLAEQTGLTSGARFDALRADLRRIGADRTGIDERGGRFDRGADTPDPMTTLPDNEYLFTSESVTEGHPDKIADQISDGVLDAVLRDDPFGRVACETLVNTGLVVVSGEITTTTYVDIQDIARSTVERDRLHNAKYGFDCHTCAVINAIDKQSPTSPRASNRPTRRAPIPATTTSSTSRARATRG